MQAGRLRMAGSVTVVLLLLVAVLLGGCTTPATLGEPLEQTAGRGGYRFDDAAPARHRDDLLLILTFSGGGTRAAALAYGVLDQLRTDEVGRDGRTHRLVDDIDVISSVSGGSITAAYFALHGDRLFRDFLSDFLEHDVEQDLWWSVFASPRNWLRLGSGRYSRGDLFAEYLDRRLFAGATFAALATGEDRPFLVLNATDLSIAGRFEFTQDWFDVICVDLARYPLARAVAASAAYPILTTPLAIENRAGRCGYVPPPWLDPGGLTVEPDRRSSLGRRMLAYQDTAQVRYVHLADGGLSDNLGIRAVIDVLAIVEDLPEAQAMLALSGVRRIAVIMVNAPGTAGERISRRPEPPGVLDVATLSGGALIDLYGQENRALLREQLARMASAEDGEASVDTYWIDIDLAAVPDAGRRTELRGVPTGFTVKPALVQSLVCAGRQLLAANPEYRRLLADLGGSSEPAPDACASDGR
jgi:NTE family protein